MSPKAPDTSFGEGRPPRKGKKPAVAQSVPVPLPTLEVIAQMAAGKRHKSTEEFEAVQLIKKRLAIYRRVMR